MQICRSLGLFASGILRQFWVWAPAFLLDPYDLWNRLVKPIIPQDQQFDLPWSPDWAPYVLVALIGWAALLTYHELRVSGPSESPKPDMPGREAFRYLLIKSKWAVGRRWKDGNLYVDVESELRDKAHNGRLTVWARDAQQMRRSQGGGFRPTLVQIQSSDWMHLNFDLPSCVYEQSDSAIYRH